MAKKPWWHPERWKQESRARRIASQQTKRELREVYWRRLDSLGGTDRIWKKYEEDCRLIDLKMNSEIQSATNIDARLNNANWYFAWKSKLGEFRSRESDIVFGKHKKLLEERQRFYISPDLMGATLRYIKGLAMRHADQLESFAKANRRVLTSTERCDLEFWAWYLRRCVTRLSETPDDTDLKLTTAAIIDAEKALRKHGQSITTSERAHEVSEKDRYLKERERIKALMREAVRGFPADWVLGFASEDPEIFKYIEIIERKYVHTLGDYERAMKALKKLELDEIPRARERLEERKQENPVEWHRLMKG